MSESRKESRKKFSYYMQLTDAVTRKLVGHLADISTGGFKLDSEQPIPVDTEYRFHLALTGEVASKSYMVFQARSKWCQSDPIDPFVYNVGFHIIEMTPEDRTIFTRVVERYGQHAR